MSADPITYAYGLLCDREQAFAAYTGRISEWWDPRYTANAQTLERVTIEGRVGGRVYASHTDIGEHVWGEVRAWEPGRRLVHSFALAQDPRHPSEVTVGLVRRDGGCTLRFAHGGWIAANVEHRAKFADWPLMLDRFAALADAGP